MDKKTKFKLLQWAEAIIWILVISLVVFGVRYHNYKEKKSFKTYQIFLQDVDGLIVGSPVRMMGVPIGYIERVKIIGDTVYVKFLITEKNTSLPKGALVTVEFNGMAGSKSLEIYPPTEQSLASNKLIVVQNTKRLNDSLSLLNDMFDKLNSMLLRGGHFAEEMADYMPSTNDLSLEKEEKYVKDIDVYVEKLKQNRLEFSKKIKELKHE